MKARIIITLLSIAMAVTMAIATPRSMMLLCNNSSPYHEPYTIHTLYDEAEIAFSLTTATTSIVTAEADSYSQINDYNDDDDEEIEYIPAGKRKKKKKRSFNSPRTKSFWGFVAGYTSKLWSKETPDGNVANVGLFDSSWLHGIQFGIRYNPLFKYGFGLNTGLYYEYYHYKSSLIEDFNEAGQYYYKTLNEHAIRFPFHVEYRLNFAKSFQLFFYGGFTAEYAFLGNMSKTRQGEYTPFEDNKDIYGSIIPSDKRYNVSFSYGGGIRIGAIQFNVSTEKGLIDVSPNKEYILKQNKPLNVSMSIMF